MPETPAEPPVTPEKWLTLDEARDWWLDAPDDAQLLHELLEAAQVAVEAYAPALDDPEHPGWAALRRAQLTHARNMWNAEAVSPAGDLGEGSFALTTHPLDWHVKQLLRPARAVPVVG